MLIDTHAHLNDERLYGEIDGIVSDMEKDGIGAIVTVGYDSKSSETAVEISNKFEKVFSAVGIHPHDSAYAKESDYIRFEELSHNPKVVAIGEIGLDYYYDLSIRETQKRVFAEQLELAYSVGLPTVIHLRDAYGDMYNILRDNKKLLKNGVVFHCYSGSAETLKQYLEFDGYFAFGGAITFKNFNKFDAIRACPKDKLLVETDCPYLTPVPFRGQTNYPKYVSLVENKLKEVLGFDVSELTTRNALNIFGKLRI